jgi:hypothetical protein
MIVIVFVHQPQEIIENILREILTAQLKQNMHCANIPVMGCRKPLRQLRDLQHKIVPKMVISRSMQSIQHLRHNNLHVLLGSHLEQQIQSLLLQGLILALQTLNHYQLVVIQQSWIGLVQHTQRLDAQVLHVIGTSSLQQFSQHRSSLHRQIFIRVQTCNRLHTLVSYCNRYVVVSLLRTPQYLLQHGVTML